MVDGPRGVPPEETKRIYRRNTTVGLALQGMHEAQQKRETKNARRHMRHHGPFRDAHNVLRNPNGRFATETAPAHKRPKRLPWASGKP